MKSRPVSAITEPPPPPFMVEEEGYLVPKPADWFTKLVTMQADLIHNTIVSLCSPFLSLLSMASQSYHSPEETKDTVQEAFQQAPSSVTHGSSLLLRRLGLGFLGAAYVCMVLLVVMVLAMVVGVGMVHHWVEEPMFVRENLHFDYTEVNPKAVFSFAGFEGKNKRKQLGVPIGHTIHVSVVLLMPESDFNRDIGVFQLTAELLSTTGDVIAKSSQPCMLRFRSPPVRFGRTLLMGVPLLLGISSETQKITVDMLRHKEMNPRTEAIRVTIIPRAGTFALPQLYEAEVVMNSQLPWAKQLVHNWKWTFYVWTSLYIYVMLLIGLIWFFRPLVFPTEAVGSSGERERVLRGLAGEDPREAESEAKDESDDVQDLLRRWQRYRSKRRAVFLQEDLPGSSASSTNVTREDTSAVVQEDFGDSESVGSGG